MSYDPFSPLYGAPIHTYANGEPLGIDGLTGNLAIIAYAVGVALPLLGLTALAIHCCVTRHKRRNREYFEEMHEPMRGAVLGP
jgi:cytochrome c biogenesis protein CcdA